MDYKKKILILTSAFPRWQGEQRDMFVFDLCKRLTLVFNVTVLVPRDKHCSSYEEYDNLKIYKHSQSPFNLFTIAYGSGIPSNIKKNPFLWIIVPFYFIYQIFSIRKIVKKYHIGAIHSFWIIPQTLSAVIYKQIFNKKIKIIATALGSDLNYMKGSIMSRLKKFILKNINSLTTQSPHLIDTAKKLNFIGTAIYSPLGIDTLSYNPDHYSEDIRSKYPGKKILLYVGNLIKDKGLDFLLTALQQISQKEPNIVLLIIGTGNEKEQLIKLICKLNIRDRVDFLGRVQELQSFYASADIFVLPSLSEGWPIVVMEALSSGTISIVTDIPTFADMKGKNEFLRVVPVKDADALAKEILDVLNMKEEKRYTAKTDARKFAQDNFDWNIVVEKYFQLFSKL